MRQPFPSTLWGNPVPDAPYPMTIAQLMQLPDDGWFYELVEGRLVRMPGSGSEASRIAARLIYFLGAFVLPRGLGDVTSSDGTFDLTLPGEATETVLVPDTAFVRAGRLPPMGTPNAKGYPKLAPDLVAEVASPRQYRPEMTSKAQMYVDRGVRLVWIIWPDRQEADVWRPSAPDAPVATLGPADSLDGLDVLPGFTCPIADLLK